MNIFIICTYFIFDDNFVICSMKALIIFLLATLSNIAGLSQDISFYELKSITIEGTEFSFDQLKGKKVMIVNTATKCSLSPQFKTLEEMYKAYSDKGFMILAFPANNFANREPGDNESIKKNCDQRFGITFPMMQKVSVKDEDIHPVYQWLTQKSQNGVMDSEIKWNFQKYLIDENGILIDIIDPMKKPDSEETISWILGT